MTTMKSKKALHPLLLNFADIECYLTEERVFVRNLICWSTEEDDDICQAYTIEEFLNALEDFTEVEGDEGPRKVITFFHNMRGFDANFILEALYDQGRTVERSLTQGAKILYFESGNLIFKDSMNFLAMALDKFPSTFHLQELHKGFFPHAFNLECHFEYSGPYLSVENYTPDDMESKKRDQFLTWHARKVAEDAVFNFQEELLKYCESDVKLLKEGCLKFVQEFQEIAGFNPLIESITIASACNLFRRSEKLEEDLIALEPQSEWRGNHINPSKVALEWLYFQDFKLRGMGRVRHVRNGGEILVHTPANCITWMALMKKQTLSLNFMAAILTAVPVALNAIVTSDEPVTKSGRSMKYMGSPRRKLRCCVALDIL